MDYGIPAAFLLFDVKDEGINSLHYFARLSFIQKCESVMRCNEIEKKTLGLIYLTLHEVSRNEGFL